MLWQDAESKASKEIRKKEYLLTKVNMLSKNTIKYVQSLQQKKFRQKYNKFVVEGNKMVLELIAGAPERIDRIFALGTWIETMALPGRLSAERIITVTEKQLQRLSGLKTANQVLAVANQTVPTLNPRLVETRFCLYLDTIRDPGNMGTILRTADWYGLPYVFSSPGCADPYSPKVVQATMGAYLRVPVIQIELGELLAKLPPLPVYGAMLEGNSLFDLSQPEKGIIVLGNESGGISPGLRPFITCPLTIPRGENGRAESLNVAVAAGIICAVFTQSGAMG